MRDLTRMNRNQIGRPYSDFERMVDDFFGNDTSSLGPWRGQELPKAELHEDEKSYSVSLDMPGMKSDDIKVNFSNGILTISGERKYEREAKNASDHRSEKYYGQFERSFRFVNDIDPESVAANYENGVLEVTLLKSPKSQARTIPVKSGTAQGINPASQEQQSH